MVNTAARRWGVHKSGEFSIQLTAFLHSYPYDPVARTPGFLSEIHLQKSPWGFAPLPTASGNTLRNNKVSF